MDLNKFINELPNNMWDKYLSPFLGPYDGSQDHNLSSFVFYWREIFHLVGGMVVGLVFLPGQLLPINHLYPASFVVGVLTIIMALKEFLGDASEQPNGWDFKNIVDFVVWGAGCALIQFGACWLF